LKIRRERGKRRAYGAMGAVGAKDGDMRREGSMSGGNVSSKGALRRKTHFDDPKKTGLTTVGEGASVRQKPPAGEGVGAGTMC